jgi:Lrp/AsnC family leucine-responsive transcriptional regulator
LLKMDGKMSYQEIADKLRRSPSTVRDRIRRMEDSEVILAYASILDMSKMGLNTDAVLFANYRDELTSDKLKKLSEIDGLTQAMMISGKKRLMIRIHAENLSGLSNIITNELIPFGLIDLDVRIVMESVLRFPGIAFSLSD